MLRLSVPLLRTLVHAKRPQGFKEYRRCFNSNSTHMIFCLWAFRRLVFLLRRPISRVTSQSFLHRLTKLGKGVWRYGSTPTFHMPRTPMGGICSSFASTALHFTQTRVASLSKSVPLASMCWFVSGMHPFHASGG